jgi:hypothetical protein
MKRHPACSKLVAVSTSAMLLIALGTTAVVAANSEVYIVNLKNGNSFLSKYKPIEAGFDASKVLIMTDVGNTVAIAKDDIAAVLNDSENRGFGTVLDTSTVLIGYTANDAPDLNDPDTAASAAQYQAQQQQFAPAPVYNSPLVGEPNSGGGIPVSFATSGAIPTSPVQGAVPPN